MSDSPQPSPIAEDVSHAYFLLLVPPPLASAEERSAWDISWWSTRPYRPQSESVSCSAYEGVPLVLDGSPEPVSLDRLSLQSTTDSQESELSPLTPTHENFTDGHGGLDATGKPADEEDSDHGRMFRASRGTNPLGNLEKRPAVHQLVNTFMGSPSNLKGMAYLARMGIAAEDFNTTTNAATMKIVELLPDTCSDLAWSLGVNHCKIAYYDARTYPDIKLENRRPIDPTEAERTRIRLTGWTPEEIPTLPQRTLLPYDLDFRSYDQWWDSQPEFEMRYADECQAYLVGRERTITLSCYDSESDSVNDVTLEMRWAIAYAVNLKLRLSKSDGVLGLSLYDHQNDGGAQRMPFPGSSFLYKLQETLPILRNDSLVMYFTVRPHPKYHPGKRMQSWVSFNRWPTSEKPTFSKKIPVHPNTYRHNCWSVTLLRIEFQRYDEHESRHYVMYREEYPQGLELLVDSGSSTSELPYQTVNGVHTTIFRNMDPLPQSDALRRTYHISQDFPIHLYRVRLEFKGDRGREDVVVYAPFKHFVCARNLSMWPDRIEDCPWQGVIFAPQKHIPYGVLGLNFFQTMFISFHKAVDGIHYLRMSTQKEDVGTYQVRFPSDSDSDD